MTPTLSGKQIVIEFPDMKCDMLSAIIDDCRQSEHLTDDVIAELHKYADLQSGLHQVCAKRSYLEKAFSRPLDTHVRYLPKSLRAKINYKLGETNFDTKLSHLVSGTKRVIAGGHEAHRTDTANFPGSISSIVATRDDAFLQYLGSVRIFETTTHASRRNVDAFSPKVRTGLMDIKKMMVERFEKCDECPEQLLFFRNSLSFDETIKSFENECRQINEPYAKVFPMQKKQIAITYVVVNKNTTVTTVPTDNIDGSMVPSMNYTVHDEMPAKYRYYVVKNENGWSKEYLQTLTRHINNSSQVSTQVEPHAKRLPLALTKKLADRTFEYYCLDTEMPAFPRAEIITNQDSGVECPEESDIVFSINEKFGILDDNESESDSDGEGESESKDPGQKLPYMRLLPWKKELDD